DADHRIIVQIEAPVDGVRSAGHGVTLVVFEVPERPQLIFERFGVTPRRRHRKERIATSFLANGPHRRLALVDVQIETRIEHAAVRLGFGDRVAEGRDTGLTVGRAIGLERYPVVVIGPDRAVDMRRVAVAQLARLEYLERESIALLSVQLGPHLNRA